MPFLEEFSTICCDQHKGFSIVNEADVFLEFFCFFYDPMGVGNLISDSSDFLFHLEYLEFLSSHTSEPSLQNFEHYFASICNECNWAVVEHSLALLTGVQPWWIQGIQRGDSVGEQDTIKLNIMYETSASPGSMHDTGCLGLVHWDNPEGWNGEGGGRRVQDGNTCIPVADSF